MGTNPFVADGSFPPLDEVAAHDTYDSIKIMGLPGLADKIPVTIVKGIELGYNSQNCHFSISLARIFIMIPY